jgi:hypothetical protein
MKSIRALKHLPTLRVEADSPSVDVDVTTSPGIETIGGRERLAIVSDGESLRIRRVK